MARIEDLPGLADAVVLLRYVDLSMELQVMSFYQARRLDNEADARMPVIRSIGRGPSAPPGRR